MLSLGQIFDETRLVVLLGAVLVSLVKLGSLGRLHAHFVSLHHAGKFKLPIDDIKAPKTETTRSDRIQEAAGMIEVMAENLGYASYR